MRRCAKLLVAIALGILTVAGSASIAAASPTASASPPAKPDLHYAGELCKTIYSKQRDKAVICVITNASDVTGEQSAQALVTYTSKSGGLRRVTIKEIYLRACLGYCRNENPRKNVKAGVKGGSKSAYISNNFAFVPDATVQAVGIDPCVIWSNGHSACWPGTHKDKTISTY
jgi:hypothetical protein